MKRLFKGWKRRHWILLAGAVVLFAIVWCRFLHVVPNEHSVGKFDDDALNYGTIGVETTLAGAFPLDVWKVLPTVFKEHLPAGRRNDGYAAFGFLQEEGKPLPVGFSKTYQGFDRVGLNCALCHTGSYRTGFEDEQVIVPGAAAITQDPQAYLRFLFECGKDPKFTAADLIPAVSALRQKDGGKLRADEKLLLRTMIPIIRSGLVDLAQTYEWTSRNPSWGPGRIDPFNPVKFGLLQRPVDTSIGNSDMMPIWDMKRRLSAGAQLHWDGLNNNFREVMVSSALGDGASPRTLDLHRIAALEDYLRDLPVPAYPGKVNQPLVAAGKEVFEKSCFDCHGDGGKKTGRLIKLSLNPATEGPEMIATDPERAFMWDAPSAERYNHYSSSYQWQFYNFADHDGYVSVPLNGIWMRAPYLHNGSVPTLWHLLHPDQRPEEFYRGCDVLDHDKIGFVWDRKEHGGRPFFRYDTKARGNSNRGHAYGAELSEADKLSLLEYLKTL